MERNQKCKKCRRAGQKLFLKGERCFSQKCAMIKRAYLPGLHGKNRRIGKLSEYGQQIREKQKIRQTYGVSEQQFKNYYIKSSKRKGNKAEFLLRYLENRLDNIIYRLGWAVSRNSARQIISHGHILVNSRRVNIPSFQVKKGDEIKIKEADKNKKIFDNLRTIIKKYEAPKWLLLDKEKIEGKVLGEPDILDMAKVGDISMVIEFYSR